MFYERLLSLKIMKKIYIILIFTFFPEISFCMHPLTADDAPTVSFENYEVETYIEGTNFVFSFKQGITNKSELGIELQRLDNVFESAINFKFNIFKNFSISFYNNFEDAIFFNLIFTKNFSNLSFHLNFGNKFEIDRSLVTYSFGLESMYKKIGFVGEIVKEKDYCWLLGTRYMLFDNFCLSCGYRNNFYFSDESLTFGLNYTF